MMLRLQRPLPLIKRGWRLYNRAALQKTRVALLTRNPKPSPPKDDHIALGRRSRVISPNTPADYEPEEALPPRVILEAGAKSGALKMKPDEALELLRRYQERQKRASKGWEAKLCREFDIKPDTLFVLAKILTKMRRWPCRHLAHRVMMSASEMGYEPATLDLVARGLGSGRFRLYEKPLRHIKSMADRGNPRALILLGRVMSARGRDEEALELIQKAMQGPAGLAFDGAGDALLYTGQLLMKKDKGQAEAALRKAALEYDDPTAYYYLAEMEKEGSLNRIVYYMKAASSGILQAAHKLGTIEMSKAVEAAKGKGSPDYRMAREWFQIAADGQYRESILSMAEICKDTGESDQEQQWLQKARDLKDGYDSE